MWTQFLANGLIEAALLLPLAIGFSLIHRTGRSLHFAHGVVFTAAAYVVYALDFLPLGLALVLAAAASAMLGALVEIAVYRPLRMAGTQPVVTLLASLGVYTVIQNALSLVWGDQSIRAEASYCTEGLTLAAIRITEPEVYAILAAGVAWVLAGPILAKTHLGLAFKAVANDSELALASGVNSNAVVLLSMVVGSFLAGISGGAAALQTSIAPTMGLMPLLIAAVGCFLGGERGTLGVVAGIAALCLTKAFIGYVAGFMWQDAMVFVILLMFLLLRPQGFLGGKAKKATV